MIEYCTKKIMMGTISGLMILCVAILYLEDTFMQHQHQQHAGPPVSLGPLPSSVSAAVESELPARKPSKNVSCPVDVHSQEPCQACSKFELQVAADSGGTCADTGFKRQVGGIGGGNCLAVWMSCKPADGSGERLKFFVAQGVSLIVFLVAFGCVRRRERQRDQLLADRVSRQLAAGFEP